MKSQNNISISILLVLFISVNELYCQEIEYKYDESTNQIFNVNTKISFKKSYVYDPETKREYDFDKLKTKIFIQIDDDGEGRFEVVQLNQKYIFTIESCYKKTYKNSSNIYWEFNCRKENGNEGHFYLHIENNKYQEIWFENSKDKRVYYHN